MCVCVCVCVCMYVYLYTSGLEVQPWGVLHCTPLRQKTRTKHMYILTMMFSPPVGSGVDAARLQTAPSVGL